MDRYYIKKEEEKEDEEGEAGEEEEKKRRRNWSQQSPKLIHIFKNEYLLCLQANCNPKALS